MYPLGTYCLGVPRGGRRVLTIDLRDTGAMLYQLSYIMKPCLKQVKCKLISYSLHDYEESEMMYTCSVYDIHVNHIHVHI